MSPAKISSPASQKRTRRSPAGRVVNHDARWRPRSRKGPVCGYKFRDILCEKRGAHYCEPRATRVVRFFAELLVHIKGPTARTAFILTWWQEHEIVRPLFGEVVWSDDWGRYVRRYRIAYIVVGRKNGKSELVSGLILYLLVGDDEDSAEVYGAAADTKQAGKVFEPMVRMVQLAPLLAARLKHIKNARRLVDERTGSHFEVITSDADGELGHNPHGFYLDEVLSQPDDSLWVAMRTALGARTQPLLICMTTETSDSASFGAAMIDEADRIMEQPARTPHAFAYVRKAPRSKDELARIRRLFAGHPDLPVSLDWHDERNWRWPNPALSDFLSLAALREEALEAADSPRKLNGFLQFRLNQRVQQITRYISMDLWDANCGPIALTPGWLDEELAGKKCWGGLDLSSKLDMTAWCLLFEDGRILWRFWVPESVVDTLDEHTDGAMSQWIAEGWVTATDGDTIDYESIYDTIEVDYQAHDLVDITYDRWSGEPVRQEVVKRTGLEMYESGTTYERMTGPMTEFMRMLMAGELQHCGNPVARWMADNLEAKSPTDDPDRVRPVKPKRDATGKRIDGLPALFFAIDGRTRVADDDSVYDYRGLSTVG